MLDEGISLREGALIKELLNALAGDQLPLRVLAF